jgi:NAD(P)H-dependent flavin oxidoreductase YrpB (nitropropane dioxygenase family)
MDLADWLRLDVPVGQAGMGGGLTGPELGAAVASAAGLGTLGLALPDQLRDSIRQIRDGAPGRAVVVNLLTPFLRAVTFPNVSTPGSSPPLWLSAATGHWWTSSGVQAFSCS